MVGSNIGESLIKYYEDIKIPKIGSTDVDVLYPFGDENVIEAVSSFYRKFFNDSKPRTLLIGINPGRNGGGVTGIPFTDPIKLEEICGLPNPFDKKAELSSNFIYEMIDHLGGTNSFYNSFLITSVCPLGFTKNGKNLNYYDEKWLQETLETYMVDNLKWHLDLVKTKTVLSLGQGKNIAYLEYINKKYNLFDEVLALPHPRWILQYRRKRLPEFLEMYRDVLAGFIQS